MYKSGSSISTYSYHTGPLPLPNLLESLPFPSLNRLPHARASRSLLDGHIFSGYPSTTQPLNRRVRGSQAVWEDIPGWLLITLAYLYPVVIVGGLLDGDNLDGQCSNTAITFPNIHLLITSLSPSRLLPGGDYNLLIIIHFIIYLDVAYFLGS